MIQPALEKTMSKKIKARTKVLPTSHVPMLSRPKDVAAVILAAAEHGPQVSRADEAGGR